MKKFEILLIIIGVLSISSCEKYLDIKTSNDQLLVSTANDCQLLLDDNGKMNYTYPSDANLSADDYFMNDADISAGLLSGDIRNEDLNLFTWKSTAIRALAAPQWQEPYYKVYVTNVILETVEKIKNKGESDATTLEGIKGAALFFRSFCFWQLAQIYCAPYSVNAAKDPGIPLRLEADVSKKSMRGSVEQTYNQIVGDLEQAVQLLPTKSIVPTRPNKAAAYAMLARVSLSMGNYSLAFSQSDAALKLNSTLINFNTLDKESNSPFGQYNIEMIFHSAAISSALISSDLSGKYARIDPNLVSSYVNDDLRKEILLKPNMSNDGTPDGTYRFSGNYEPNSTQLFNGLAVDEIYLIRAECYARQGNTQAAMTDLNTLLITRWKSGVFVPFTAISSEDALIQILNERRKELLMRGLRWSDLRRINQDSRFAKTLIRSVNSVSYSLPPNDLRYTLLIPQEVITNGNIDQNQR